MYGMQLTGGQVWILPVGADDFQHLTADVASYEKDGELRLAESAGAVVSVELTPVSNPSNPL